MNAEISRISKNKCLKEDNKIARIPNQDFTKYAHSLNRNMGELYFACNKEDLDVDSFVFTFVKNFYIILNMFKDMHVYPDGFFDLNIDKVIEKKRIDSTENLKRTGQSYLVPFYAGMKRALLRLKKGKISLKGNVSDDYQKVQDRILEHHLESGKDNIRDIFESYYPSIWEFGTDIATDIIDDIENLEDLLYYYLCFFVEIGINPQEYLNKYIDIMNDAKKDLRYVDLLPKVGYSQESSSEVIKEADKLFKNYLHSRLHGNITKK